MVLMAEFPLQHSRCTAWLFPVVKMATQVRSRVMFTTILEIKTTTMPLVQFARSHFDQFAIRSAGIKTAFCCAVELSWYSNRQVSKERPIALWNCHDIQAGIYYRTVQLSWYTGRYQGSLLLHCKTVTIYRQVSTIALYNCHDIQAGIKTAYYCTVKLSWYTGRYQDGLLLHAL